MIDPDLDDATLCTCGHVRWEHRFGGCSVGAMMFRDDQTAEAPRPSMIRFDCGCTEFLPIPAARPPPA